MRTTSRILLFIAGIGAMGALVVLLVSFTCVSRCPEWISRAVETRMHRELGQAVSIEGMSLDLLKGTRIVLRGVQIGSSEELSLEAAALEVGLSPWKLLLGKVSLRSLVLKQPSGVIHVERLRPGSASGGKEGFPDLFIEDGSIRIILGRTECALSRINGSLSRSAADLSLEALGSRLRLSASYPSPAQITLKAENLDLSMLGDDVFGSAGVHAFVAYDGKDLDAALDLQVASLGLPWQETPLGDAALQILAQGPIEKISLDEISVKTALLNIEGSGELTGLSSEASPGDTWLTLEMRSSEFDYEQVVDSLPVESFPEWLRELLMVQIRGGRSIFSRASYSGRLGELFSGETFFRNISVVQDLMNQRFSAGHTSDRVEGITGAVIYGPRDIEFRNLSGSVGQSSLERVNLLFHDVLEPLMRLTVEVDLDMEASAFLGSWRAAMVPQEVFSLLSPVKTPTAGRVKAQVSTFWDEGSGNPVQLRGSITLEDCSYTWESHQVSAHSGSISAPTYDSPVQVFFTGTVDRTAIDELALTLEKPFDENLSCFTLKTDLPLEGFGFRLDSPSRVVITGTGTGQRLQGIVKLSTAGFTLMDTHYVTLKTPFEATGGIQALLGPSPEVQITNLGVTLGNGTMNISARARESAGSARITGVLHLEDLAAEIAQRPQNLQGVITSDLSLMWGEHRTVSGQVVFDDVSFFYGETPVTFDGAVQLEDSTASSQVLLVTLAGMKSTLAGSLLIADTPSYTGSLTVDGLSLASGQAMESSDIFTRIEADATLELTNLDLYGIPVEKGSTEVQLKHGVLTLSRMDLQGLYGTAKGSARREAGGETSYDLVISLRNAPVRRVLSTLSPGQTWIDGTLDLDGHLWGDTASPNGTFTLIARDGRIRRYALFNSIFTVLNVYRIIQVRDLELTSRNFPYNFISSTLHIDEGLVSFDDFYLDSNSLQVSAVGSYSLQNHRIDATLGIQPLESIDRTISMIPLLGWVLTGDEEKLIVVFLRVKGDVDEPSVQVKPLKTFERPVVTTLLRALKLSTDLFNRSQQFIPGQKN